MSVRVILFCSGVEDSEGWNEHRTREGVSYYHNSCSGKSQWEKPAEFKGQSTELNRDEIQVNKSWRTNTQFLKSVHIDLSSGSDLSSEKLHPV